MGEINISDLSLIELQILNDNAKNKANELRGNASINDINFSEYNYWQDTVRIVIGEEICKRTKSIING